MPEVRLIDANALAESDMAKLIDRYLYNQCNLTVGLAAALMPEIEAEPVRKSEISEADRKECEEWCKDCEHIEMCKWYPFGGCDFRLFPKPEQSAIEADIDRAAIMRLCNEIEDIVSEISKLSENYLIYSDCKSILDRTKAIGKELSEDAGHS